MDMAMKLIEGLTACVERERDVHGSCGRCPYKMDDSCQEKMMCDAIAYIVLNERGKHMFDNCVDIKDLNIGDPYDKRRKE